jgi:hypothetical protein
VRPSERLGMTEPPQSYAKERLPLQPRPSGLPASPNGLFAYPDTRRDAHRLH